MSNDVLAGIPVRRGHFLLESGYHSDSWFTLDAMFVDPRTVAPMVARLSDCLRPYGLAGVCGPLVGGAFLAQLLAMNHGVAFYHTEPLADRDSGELFATEYVLPPVVRQRVRGQRVAVVDDVISAGSSVRATVAALQAARAIVPVVAAPLVLGTAALDHFSGQNIPVEMLQRRELAIWKPDGCPHCERGEPLEDPRSMDREAGA